MTKDQIQDKANGLSSSTRIEKYTEDLGNGVSEEWHKHPVTGETIIMHTWSVPDGECISREFEVVEVIPKGGYLGDLIRMCNEAVADFKSYDLNKAL